MCQSAVSPTIFYLIFVSYQPCKRGIWVPILETRSLRLCDGGNGMANSFNPKPIFLSPSPAVFPDYFQSVHACPITISSGSHFNIDQGSCQIITF